MHINQNAQAEPITRAEKALELIDSAGGAPAETRTRLGFTSRKMSNQVLVKDVVEHFPEKFKMSDLPVSPRLLELFSGTGSVGKVAKTLP